jgi:hypothetical protein
MKNLLKHHKWIFFFVMLLVALAIVVPVLADYLGPNRTVTTTVSVCKVYLYKCTEVEPGKWDDVKVEDWLCSNESKPWLAYDSGGGCFEGNNNHKHWESGESTQTTTITHPPATISGSLQNCTLYNGWCGVNAPELVLSANEPLPGYNITLIEGTLNGGSFACPSGATSCSLPLNQGDNTFNYWALSSWGDSSSMGTTTVKVDTVPPEVSLSISGVTGNNGWYKSAVQVSANATDATSGVTTFEVAVDGGDYQAYTNNTIISFSTDARHTLQFRVVDHAGNLFEPPAQNFYVDTIPPTVNLPASWQLGTNVPYDVIDEGSGLGALRIVIEDEDEKYAKVAWDQEVSGHTYSQDIDWNGQFKDKTVAPPGTYLVWLKASDVAGNEKFYLGKVIVPEPSYVGSVVLPTEAPIVSVAPPAELSQPETTTSTSPESAATSEGTGTTTTHTFTLTSGAAGGTTSGSAATTSPGILWGPMAVAASAAATAYALNATRKRKEAEEEQAAQVKAEVARSKAERAEKKQKQQENWNKQHPPQQNTPPPPSGISPDAQQAYMHGGASAQGWISANVPQLQQTYVKQQKQQKEAARKWAEKKKAEEQAAKNAKSLANLPGYFNSEKRAEPQVPPMCIHEPEEPKVDPPGKLASEYFDPWAGMAVGGYAAWKASSLRFRELESGYISVSATTPEGTRMAYRAALAADQDFDFQGFRYLPETVASKTASGLIKGAVNGDAWMLAGGTSFISNSIEYGWGATSVDDFANRTVKNQDFWASTAADTVVGVATGLAAAAIVGGAIVGAVALGFTAPVWLAIGATVLVAAGIGWGLSALGVNNALQGVFNQGIDWAQSLFD